MFKISTAYCDLCKKRVTVRAEGVNHVLHLLLSIITGGFWIIIWFIWAMLPDNWYCTECGQRVQLGSTKPTDTCPKCKAVIEKDVQFCPHCGTVMEKLCGKCNTKNELNALFCKNAEKN